MWAKRHPDVSPRVNAPLGSRTLSVRLAIPAIVVPLGGFVFFVAARVLRHGLVELVRFAEAPAFIAPLQALVAGILFAVLAFVGHHDLLHRRWGSVF